ncbi:two-component regulatory system sensor histidine kinase BtsS [Wohlfahrtiimonas larvae]|uniref:Two-component regulatory system sensor histidine kinase BtsS n=2 Tax=Wohlfahrtiimonas larvae TaxID=1157986 RepID=A0ABP9MR05_9GAMM
MGLHINDSIANIRAIGAVVAGLMGGPLVGFAVGLVGGIHRYTIGGMTVFSCSISTVCAGLVAGCVQAYLWRCGKIEKLLNPWTAATVTLVVELLQFINILLLSKPYDEALALVKNIAMPMLITNTIGSAMFMQMLVDRRSMCERYTSAFSERALKIAVSTEGILSHGFNQANSMKVAQVIYEELGLSAVAITDIQKILAFIGVGDDHHKVNTPIASKHTRQAIENKKVVYVDGNEIPYRCSIDHHCRLGSTLIIPLLGEDKNVIGTIKLYEVKNKLFSSINRTLGEGIASLLSSQILAGQYERNQQLLAQSEIKLLHAQVNPHFLFNAFNTLVAIIRKDSNEASQLVQHLSTFFRKNLKRSQELVTLADELEHINAYLYIEKARLMDRLSIQFNIEEHLLNALLPAFSLQPIIENAIKHGITQTLNGGQIIVSANLKNNHIILSVEDDAGLYHPTEHSDGLGMNLVNKRIKVRYGEQYGLSVIAQPEAFTKIMIDIPYITTKG